MSVHFVSRRNLRARLRIALREYPLLLCASLLLCGISVNAAESTKPAGKLDEVIVTGTRILPLKLVPQSVSVITAENIEEAPANSSLMDILSREANISLRSFTGTDKKGGIDIRGMGDTFSSNVLVLVDGVKLNTIDQGGPDLSSIALAEIERIEIVRGASSVRYGDGAVGGVVNIITRQPAEGLHARVRTSRASFNTIGAIAQLGYGGDSFGINAVFSDSNSDGYRENGELDRHDFKLDADWKPINSLRFFAGGKVHRDSYGLPGPVSAEAFEHGSDAERRKSVTPNDGGDTDTDSVRAGFEYDTGRWGSLRVSGSWQHREDAYIIGFSELLSEEEQRSLIEQDTQGAEIGYRLPLDVAQRYVIDIGGELDNSNYTRFANGKNITDSSQRKTGGLDHHGYFVALAFTPIDPLRINVGYRNDIAKLDQQELVYRRECAGFGPPPNFEEIDCQDVWNLEAGKDARNERWRNEASEIGVVYTLQPGTTLYASHARSFRNPNLDDLVLADSDLAPQAGKHWEAGIRYEKPHVVETSLGVYRMDIDDEIFYGKDPEAGLTVNRNSDEPTRRDGIEWELRIFPLDTVSVWMNATLLKARFKETSSDVPLVPEHTANIGAQWQLGGFSLSVAGRYVGSRADGNTTPDTTYPKLDSYHTLDSKIAYRWREWQVFAGVNNLTDGIYSASAYSNTYYPMPGRNWYAGLQFEY